ncbi:MAG: VOC family protein [Propionibacteriaceae bacterium]|jgi:PhnB protein|nr:VOC family protein [Propionibacteriaceae bacterium]
MFSHYLMFNGVCAQALEAYAKAFGATVAEKRTYADVPNPGFEVTEQMKSLVLHSRLVWDGSELMCADSTDPVRTGGNMYISMTTDDEALVRQAWAVLADGGHIHMELTPTFFAAAHGSLQDRFGVNWMFTANA